MTTRHTDSSDTRYQRAREDYFTSDALKQVARLHRVVLGQLLCIMVLLGMFAWWWMHTDPPVQTFVVEVGPDHRPVPVDHPPVSYQPKQTTIMREIADWLLWVRSVSPDAGVMAQYRERSYHFVTHSVAGKLTQWHKQCETERQHGSKRAVVVQVLSVVPISDKSFYATWEEQYFDEHSAKVGTLRFTGTFNVVILPPKTVDTVLKNPLGIYIDHFSWQQELVSQRIDNTQKPTADTP